MPEVTQLLNAIGQGDPRASADLLPLVYEELRKLAAQKLVQEKPGQTLQATALVHEAYLRLVHADRGQGWDNRGHFFAAAAEAMRRILVENVRHKRRLKHGGEFQRVDVDQCNLAAAESDDRLLAVDEALDRLAAEEPKAAELVKLHFFAGFSIPEAAEALGLSRTTAYELWSYARAWLRCEIEPIE